MVKARLKLSKAAYVIGLLRLRKFQVSSALNLTLMRLTTSWQLDLTNS
jgi:hypothetical protein